MELKDSELDSLIEMSLSEDFIPSQELNMKLKQKLDKKSAFTIRYFFNVKTAVAAAAIVLVSVAAFKSADVLDDLGQNTNIATNVENTKKALITNNDTQEVVSDESIPEVAEVSFTDKTIKNKAVQKNQDMSRNIQSKGYTSVDEENQVSGQTETVIQEAAVAEYSQESLDVAATMDTFSQSADYITIAAGDNSEVYNTLNDVVNSYIESVINGYNTGFDVAMASEAVEVMPKLRSAEVETSEEDASAENSGGLNVDASYEVLTDSERYFSIEVHTKINEEQQENKMFTVDKAKSEIITLDSLYNYDENYKNELSKKINEQIDKDAEITITGFENFYLNENEEVIISLAQGEFNVGQVN